MTITRLMAPFSLPASAAATPSSISQITHVVTLLVPTALLILLPVSDLLPGFGMYDEKRLLQVVWLTTLGFTMLLLGQMRSRILSVFSNLSVPAAASLLLVFVFGVTASLDAAYPRWALVEVALFGLLWLAALCFASVHRGDTRRTEAVLSSAVLAIGIAYLALFAAGYAAAVFEDVPLIQRDLYGNFSNIRFFNQFLSWLLPLMLLPLACLPPKRGMKALVITVTAGWWTLLFASSGRGSLMALAVAFTMVVGSFGSGARPWLRLQLTGLLIGLALYALLFLILPPVLDINVVRNPQFFERGLVHSGGRLTLWTEALRVIGMSPWTGIGPMHFACLPGVHLGHPHNAPLQIAAEWGLPTLVLVGYLVLAGTTAWIRATRSVLSAGSDQPGGPDQRPFLLYSSLLASWTAGITHGMVSGVIVTPLSQVLMAAVGGWMLGLYRRSSPPLGSAFRVGFMLLVAGSVIVMSSMLHEIAFRAGAEAFFADGPTAQPAPRFWQQGNICFSESRLTEDPSPGDGL